MLLSYVSLCYVIPCHAVMLCYAMRWYAMPCCHVILCHAMLWYVYLMLFYLFDIRKAIQPAAASQPSPSSPSSPAVFLPSHSTAAVGSSFSRPHRPSVRPSDRMSSARTTVHQTTRRCTDDASKRMRTEWRALSAAVGSRKLDEQVSCSGDFTNETVIKWFRNRIRYVGTGRLV